MKISNLVFAALAGCLFLSACGTTKEDLGLRKKAPNEFLVGTRAPLSLPPEYNLLPVSQEKYQEEKEEKQAQMEEEFSPAEQAVLIKMGR